MTMKSSLCCLINSMTRLALASLSTARTLTNPLAFQVAPRRSPHHGLPDPRSLLEPLGGPLPSEDEEEEEEDEDARSPGRAGGSSGSPCAGDALSFFLGL